MLRFNQRLYNPYDGYASDQEYLDEGFASSIKEKLGLAPKSKLGQAFDSLKGKLGMKEKSKFAQALDSIKGKFGSQKKSAFGQALDHLKANKGRIAARAAGQIGAHLLYNKATGKGYKDDWLNGSLGDKVRRIGVSHAGANIGDAIYQKFSK